MKLPSTDGGFGVVLADPPWSYNNSATRGGVDNHYVTMSDADIAEMPIADLAADNAVLFLWATWPKLSEAFDVVKGWGFEYITGLPWVKCTEPPSVDLFGKIYGRPQYGVGFWVRGCSEPLLIARRGKVSPDSGGQVGLLSENFGHSRKPDNVYGLAERYEGPYLELFARRTRTGWVSWGNEIGGNEDANDGHA